LVQANFSLALKTGAAGFFCSQIVRFLDIIVTRIANIIHL